MEKPGPHRVFPRHHQKGVAVRTGSTAIIPGHTVVRVRNIAVWTVRLRLQNAIHEDPHPAIAPPSPYGDVIPLCVERPGNPADRVVPHEGRVIAGDAKDGQAAGNGQAEFPILIEAMAVKNDIAINPVDILGARNGRGGIFRRVGFHPEFQAEVLGASIGRGTRVVANRIVDLNFYPVDIAHAVSIKPESGTGAWGGKDGSDAAVVAPLISLRSYWDDRSAARAPPVASAGMNSSRTGRECQRRIILGHLEARLLPGMYHSQSNYGAFFLSRRLPCRVGAALRAGV